MFAGLKVRFFIVVCKQVYDPVLGAYGRLGNGGRESVLDGILFMYFFFLHCSSGPLRQFSARHPALTGLLCPIEVTNRVEVHCILDQSIKVKVQSIRIHQV